MPRYLKRGEADTIKATLYEAGERVPQEGIPYFRLKPKGGGSFALMKQARWLFSEGEGRVAVDVTTEESNALAVGQYESSWRIDVTAGSKFYPRPGFEDFAVVRAD